MAHLVTLEGTVQEQAEMGDSAGLVMLEKGKQKVGVSGAVDQVGPEKDRGGQGGRAEEMPVLGLSRSEQESWVRVLTGNECQHTACRLECQAQHAPLSFCLVKSKR